MAPQRRSRSSRLRPPVLAVAFLPFCLQAAEAPSNLVARWQDHQLRVEAPQLHFLGGSVLQRLQDGHAVGLEFQLAISHQPSGAALKRALERFVVSYDLWEEKFSVYPARRGHKPASYLTASQAEAWCLDRVLLSTSGIPPGRPVWIRLDIRAEDVQAAASAPGDEPFDLTGLIDLFSRQGRDRSRRWTLHAGPVALAGLRQDAPPGRAP